MYLRFDRCIRLSYKTYCSSLKTQKKVKIPTWCTFLKNLYLKKYNWKYYTAVNFFIMHSTVCYVDWILPWLNKSLRAYKKYKNKSKKHKYVSNLIKRKCQLHSHLIKACCFSKMLSFDSFSFVIYGTWNGKI